MKIAVSGKGGVGKTLIAGTLARLFAQDDYNVLAIDNDSAMNLSYTLGIDPEIKEKIVPISEMTSLVEERTKVEGAGEGVYNITPKVSDIPDRFKVSGPDGLELLVLGGIEDPATGCLCPENALIRTLLYNLFVKRDEVVIVDFEAGLEHLGRGTAKGIDVMLVIAEPSQKSLDLCAKIIDLSKKLGIINIFLVANKVIDDSQLTVINERVDDWEIPLYHSIPFDPEIGTADLKGKPPVDHNPDSKGVKSIRNLYRKLKKLKIELFDL
ncbi:MAG: Carbon monoxide dehydrogenase accessory protein CooC [Promethearchaeota archaeon]|nr:MAG: Carbon monoxide dehydrogenase accessory protein CooC [Candidatus Lokiarchaeota archaeon]